MMTAMFLNGNECLISNECIVSYIIVFFKILDPGPNTLPRFTHCIVKAFCFISKILTDTYCFIVYVASLKVLPSLFNIAVRPD